MRTIERTGQFKRDYKRESKSRHRVGLDEALIAVLRLLVADKRLPPSTVTTHYREIGLITATAI